MDRFSSHGEAKSTLNQVGSIELDLKSLVTLHNLLSAKPA